MLNCDSVNQHINGKTHKFLREYGWNPGRDIGERTVREWEDVLKSWGYSPFAPAVERLLRVFGNLTIPTNCGLLLINPVETYLKKDRGVMEIGEQAGENLWPCTQYGEFELLLGNSGRIITVEEKPQYLPTFYEFLRRIAHQQEYLSWEYLTIK